MAIKHATTKAPLQKVFAVADWNANHTIDPNTITAAQTQFADQDVKIASSPTFANLTIPGNITGGDTLTIVTGDHGAAATDEVVNVSYGTGAPPAANTTTIGSIFVKYTA